MELSSSCSSRENVFIVASLLLLVVMSQQLSVSAAAAATAEEEEEEARISSTTTTTTSPCEFPAIFNFGDSNSDTGGLSAVFGQVGPPSGETYFHAPAGRYCDGRLVIDFIGKYTYIQTYRYFDEFILIIPI